MPVYTRIQVRRDTAANWTSVNPLLGSGEIGFETDTGKYKIGDNSTQWTSLGYKGGPTSAFSLTLFDDTTAGAWLTTLGVTAAAQTILDDTTVAAIRATLLVDRPDVLYAAADVDDDYDTNTTLANWAGIAVTLPAAGHYEVQGTVNYSATNVAVGLKLGLTCTNFADGVIRVDLNGDGTTFVSGLIVASGGSVSETATPAGGQSVGHWRGYIRTSASGVLQMQGARNTDTGDHTVTVSHAVLRARLIPD